MTKFNERFFCPCPWETMYYHIDQPSPCHLIRHGLNFTPKEYLESDWLKEIKTQFVNGEVPSFCQTGCKSREDLGLKSTRGAAWGFFNVGDYPEIDISSYTVDRPTVVRRLELRSTNLCNYKCRMCNEDSSSEIAKEKKQKLIPLKFSFTSDTETTIHKTKESSIVELKELAVESLNRVCFTGGEPLLIKQYYDYMDFLVENDLNNKIKLEIYTNCSVYNPAFVDRMLKFSRVDFIMSIDAVGKTAEYQRSGTKWNIQSENFKMYAAMPKSIYITTAISAYVVLDASALAKFLMELYNINSNIGSKCYTVNTPTALNFENLDGELREKAISELTLAAEILKPASGYDILRTEFLNIKSKLESNEPKNMQEFVEYTKDLDLLRGESFEQVFGHKIY